GTTVVTVPGPVVHAIPLLGSSPDVIGDRGEVVSRRSAGPLTGHDRRRSVRCHGDRIADIVSVPGSVVRGGPLDRPVGAVVGDRLDVICSPVAVAATRDETPRAIRRNRNGIGLV